MEAFPANFSKANLMAKDQALLLGHARSKIYDLIMSTVAPVTDSGPHMMFPPPQVAWKIFSVPVNTSFLDTANTIILLRELLDLGFPLSYHDASGNNVVVLRDNLSDACSRASSFNVHLQD
jgi:hypothetical protein